MPDGVLIGSICASFVTQWVSNVVSRWLNLAARPQAPRLNLAEGFRAPRLAIVRTIADKKNILVVATGARSANAIGEM